MGKNIVLVIFSNVIQLLSSVLICFMIPAILPINDYAQYKTYTLIISYIGILHFGYVDGISQKYVGRKKFSENEFFSEYLFFVIMQIILSVLFAFIAIKENNKLFILIAFSILPFNLLTFYKRFYQAIGEFKIYSALIINYSIAFFILNLLIYLSPLKNSFFAYSFCYILANSIIILYVQIKSRELFAGHFKINLHLGYLKYIKTGIFILFGNLAVNLFYSIDRWFVKYSRSANDFAYYSFAVSILNIGITIINAISVTMYNYLAVIHEKSIHKKIQKCLMLLGSLMSFLYFPIVFIVENFLEKYEAALPVISFTFSLFPVMMVINAFYLNVYKLRKQEKRYARDVAAILVIGSCLNFIALYWDGIIMFAIATCISFILWFLWLEFRFKDYRFSVKEILLLVLQMSVFFFCTYLKNYMIGGIVYLTLMAILFFPFYKKDIRFFLMQDKASNV